MSRRSAPQHLAVPRTLLFLEREGRLLLIRGAPHKWWAGRWNGLGGSVLPGEDLREAALREAREETGLEPVGLELCALGHVDSDPPVLLLVFRGGLPPGEAGPTAEGELRWFDPEGLRDAGPGLMPDLPGLLPRVLAHPAGASPFFFRIDAEGETVLPEADPLPHPVG